MVSRDICANNGYGTSITSPPDKRFQGTITTNAITFHGRDLCYRATQRQGDTALSAISSAPCAGSSVLYGNFTFISPTVYMAHHPVTGSVWHWSGLDIVDFLEGTEVYTGDFDASISALLPAGVIALHEKTFTHCIQFIQTLNLVGQPMPRLLPQDYLGHVFLSKDRLQVLQK